MVREKKIWSEDIKENISEKLIMKAYEFANMLLNNNKDTPLTDKFENEKDENGIRKYAQKSPAGPHPTTTGRDFNFSLPPAGKTYGIASWSCTLPARFFRVSIFKSCFSLSAFTSTV